MVYIVVFIIGALAGGFLIYYLKDRDFRSKLNTKAGEVLDRAGKNMYPNEKKSPVKKLTKRATKTNGTNP